MQNLPTAEIYEKEFRYMPWGILIKEILTIVVSKLPQNGSVLDLLCGPGYLLGQLQKLRSDANYTGVDMEPEFIAYARKQYPSIAFEVADAFEWKSDYQFDVVLCTAGLHHLPYDKQEPFVGKLATLIKDGGFAVVAGPFIADYSNETERKLAGAKLGYEYLVATIRNGASDDVVEATVGVLLNDVLLVEFKSSIKRVKLIFEKYFPYVEMYKTWPSTESEFGDYYFILKR